MGYYFAASAIARASPSMRSRDLIFVAGSALLLGAALLLALGAGPAQPVEAATTGARDAAPPTEAAAPTEPADPAPAAAVPPVPLVVEMESTRQVDTSAWTSGRILGDIQLATSVLDRIQSIGIQVEECRSPIDSDGKVVRPWKRFVPVPMGVGTPTFEITDVPFSQYGYVVRVHSPGLNGSQQTVAITRESPLKEVVLSITRGSPYSLLLRDQDHLPVFDTDALLMPHGEPPGRPVYQGRSDNFGCVVFQDVLAGDYRVVVGHAQRPLAEPVDITVQPGAHVSRGVVQPQGTTVTVPRGQPLVVAAQDVAGYGMADVLVKVLATDKTRLSVLEDRTDYSGRATFPFLPPGIYQIDLYREGFERRSRMLTVKEGEPPAEQSFQLVRTR